MQNSRPGKVEVREPVDRGERRLAGAVAVVEQVLAERVVRRDRRERQLSGRLHRAQPRDAGRRLLGHARESCRDLGPVLDDPRRQLGAVVDDDLRLRVGDREQVGVELLARGAVRARAPRSRARRARRRSRPGSSRGSSRRRRPARPRRRAASPGTRSSPRDGRRPRRASRAAPRRRAARARAGSGRASASRPTRIRCSPSGASDGSAISERAAASTAGIYPADASTPARTRVGQRAGVKPRKTELDLAAGPGGAPLGVAPLRLVDEAGRRDGHALADELLGVPEHPRHVADLGLLLGEHERDARAVRARRGPCGRRDGRTRCAPPADRS